MSKSDDGSKVSSLYFRTFESLGAAHVAVATLCASSLELRVLDILPTADGALSLLELKEKPPAPPKGWLGIENSSLVLDVVFGLQEPVSLLEGEEIWIVDCSTSSESVCVLDRVLNLGAQLIDWRLRRSGKAGATAFFKIAAQNEATLKKELQSRCEVLEKITICGDYARHFFNLGLS